MSDRISTSKQVGAARLKNSLVERLVAAPQPTIVDLVSLDEVPILPPDSVLLRTLPDVLALSEGESDQIWDAFGRLSMDDLGLAETALMAMRRPYLCAQDSLELLLSSSIDYLHSLFLSDPSFDALLEAVIAEISARVGHEVHPRLDLLSSRPFISGVANGFAALPLTTILGTRLSVPYFEDEGLRHIRDLANVSENSLFRSAGFGAPAIRAARLCWSLREELAWLGAIGDLPEGIGPSSSLSEEVQRALSASTPEGRSRKAHRRAVRVLLQRLGVESGSPMTLEEVGRAHGLTRERIRQIEAKTIDAVDLTEFMAELVPLRRDVFCIVAAKGWGMLTADLSRELAESRGWAEAPFPGAMTAVAAMLPECSSESDQEVILLSAADCRDCSVLTGVLEEVRVADCAVPIEEVLSRLADAASSARPECTACAEQEPRVFAALLASALDGQVDLVRNVDGWLLPPGKLGRRPNSLAFRARETLRRAGRGMHFTELAELLAANSPADVQPKPRNVYAALDRDPEVVSWDTGSFIHKECMPFPYAVIRMIEDWLLERLAGPTAPPMLSVHGVHERFRPDCESHDVPSELALYSLLRLSNEPGLVYPRYPRIYRSAGFTQRLPLALVIEDYVRDAGGPVSLRELRGFVMQDMGFKEFQLANALGEIPSVLRTADGAFIHADYLRVDKRSGDKIAKHAEALVHEEQHVSVQRVFDDLKVDCMVSGIDSPELLFSLLQLAEPEDLIATRFPMLIHREDKQASTLSIQASIAAYLDEKGAPCSAAELEDEFVEKRGYSERIVHLAWLRSDVFRYLPGSLVHAATIGWNGDKQGALEQVAYHLVEDALRAGRFFATINDLLEHGSPPSIGEELVWTRQLAADLLSRRDRFLLLGNARNAFLTNPNDPGILGLGDLVAEIVRREYGGGVNLSKLETRLKSDGVILKNLTAAMLGDTTRARVDGQEVVLVSSENA
jgi:Sigma-70, region 4